MMNELYGALSRAQGKVENAKRTSFNPGFKSNYADLATVWDTIREVFASEGLCVVQLPCEAPMGQVGLLTIVGHTSGQEIRQHTFQSLKRADDPQNAGSCITYLRRYALMGVAGIAPEDDDANAAAGVGKRGSPAPAAVDYTSACAEALADLEKADEAQSRVLYATVRNSGIPDAIKNPLLVKMGDIIKTRMATATKGTK